MSMSHDRIVQSESSGSLSLSPLVKYSVRTVYILWCMRPDDINKNMHRSVSSSKIYRMSASRASRKGDSLLYENGTVNFVLAINSEGEHSFR